MDLHDYLLDQEGKDWSSLLSDWSGVLPQEFTIWLVNRFGDLFIVFKDESVHMLDVGLGELRRVADDRARFCDELDHDDKAADWLMISLVDRCVGARLHLGKDQCYGYKIPPILGGEYSVGNVAPIDLQSHYSFLADMYRQAKDLPDATQVKLVIGKP